MNLEDLEKLDSEKMFKTYDKWPEIAKQSFDSNFEKLDVKRIDHLVFAGMGGSGSIGDVISAILSKENIHVSNVKGYLLPKTVDSNTLIIIISVSGNTQETLSILQSAHSSDASVIAFSSGGKIEEYCTNEKIPFQKISMEHSPRASFPSFLFGILNVLEKIVPINKEDTQAAISSLEETKNKIYSHNLNDENISLKLAKKITKIPLVYYPKGLEAAAIRFKNSLQENSKLHVITENVLETCHNGIVAWKNDNNFQPILIRGHDDHDKTKERWTVLKEFFQTKNIDYLELYSLEGSILTKIINLIYVLDYASIYHAIINNIDPSPVESIDFVKKRISV